LHLNAFCSISKNTRLNAKFFFPLGNGIEFGSYHKLFLDKLTYGCYSEYLFPASPVNALAINSFKKEMEKAAQDVIGLVIN
jgi:hypothetical protein